MPHLNSQRSSRFLFFFWAVLIASFFTYFYNYQSPPYVFWDEPYHIASAQKYLNSVYFMEQHPPLGKLLIALGEKLVKANEANNQFINTDYATNFPSDFSFAGYRFFPTLLAWLTAPLLYVIFFLINRNPKTSALFSCLYIFDNALIVHNRGAMIDSTLLFFSVLMIAMFLFIVRFSDRVRWIVPTLFFLGFTFGLVMTTKLVGLIMILLFIPLAYVLRSQRQHLPQYFSCALLGFLISFCGVWYIHFALGTTVNPVLNNSGYYQASQSYKDALTNKKTGSPAMFPVMLRDSIKYVGFYNKGVPKLDLTKPDENGSPFFFWPIGAKSINYRWHSAGTDTYRYLYLQANPVVWAIGLFGVITALAMAIATAFFPLKKPFSHRVLLFTFLGMYLSYMAAISQLDRVMYLYHYFTPLIFSFILFVIVFDDIHLIGNKKLRQSVRSSFVTCVAVAIVVSFFLYRPLTYYGAISNAALTRLAVVSLWDLHCVNCPRTYWLVQPAK